MLHVWNEINSGIAQFSATHDNITVQFFIIQTNKHTAYTYINNNILYIVNTAIQPNLTQPNSTQPNLTQPKPTQANLT